MLEEELSKFAEREFCLMTSSGSAAIIAALRSLGLPEDAEVIMPSISCPAVLSAIQLAGYKAVFADVDSKNFCMGPSQIEQVKSKKSKVILAIHSFGKTCLIQDLLEYARKKNLFLIEDACLALGGTVAEGPLGSFGDISIFSFGYDKIIDSGGGGALLTNKKVFFRRAQKFLGENIFFSDFSDGKRSYVQSSLRELSDLLTCRKEHAFLLANELDTQKVGKLIYAPDEVCWRYTCLYKGNRDKLIESAGKKGIVITSHYRALHPFRTGIPLNNAEEISNRVINFFVKKGTPKEYFENVINFVHQFPIER
jgi:perosamine synthetase